MYREFRAAKPLVLFILKSLEMSESNFLRPTPNAAVFQNTRLMYQSEVYLYTAILDNKKVKLTKQFYRQGSSGTCL